MYKIVFSITLAFLTGCATFPTDEEIAAADYGQKPTQYKQKIEEYLKSVLLDPESAQVTNYSTPKKDWLVGSEGYGFSYAWGEVLWLACMR